MKDAEFRPTTEKSDVCIVGMGYVGLTLAIAFAEQGMQVIGCEANGSICRSLNVGQPHFVEKGVRETLQRRLGRWLKVTPHLPPELPSTVIVCVGTPVDEVSKEPNLQQLEAAVMALAERMSADTLVIVRSTVPIGTCRNLVLPLLRQRVAEPLLAFCPERTIQGKALEELVTLPQIVGGLDEISTGRAKQLFQTIASQVITVSSLEAAEMVKLICNAHTDLIYGFGNEVALMAEALGLDASELIGTANLNYPRPDLSKPGFVGGSCLSKDPYLLIHSSQTRGYFPAMVAAARQLNESLPRQVGECVLAVLQELGCDLAQAKILLAGLAYKGQPETDDLRGAPVHPILDLFRDRVRLIVGHDFVVSVERIAALGVEPVDLEEGFVEADAALILNNHVKYRAQDIHSLTAKMKHPSVLFDVWGILQDRFQDRHTGVRYMRLGRG